MISFKKYFFKLKMFINYAIENEQLKIHPLSRHATFKEATKHLKIDIEHYLETNKIENVKFYSNKNFDQTTHHRVYLKHSSGWLYKVDNNSGWLTNTVNTKKLIKFGVLELDFEEFEKVKSKGPTNYDHGNHVNFLNELKDVIKKRGDQNVTVTEVAKKPQKENPFVVNLQEKMKNLKPTVTVVKTLFDLFDKDTICKDTICK